MKILLVPVGSAGDVHPFLGIGLGLRARGHDVSILTNDHFRQLCERLGFEFLPLGTDQDYRNSIADEDLWHPRKGFAYVVQKGIVPWIEPLYNVIAERFADGETLVIAAAIALGARVAQEKLGIPLITVQLQPGAFPSIHQPPVYPTVAISKNSPKWMKRLFYRLVDTQVIGKLLGEPLNAFRSGLGLKPARMLMFEWWNSPLGVLGLFPPWFGDPQPDWPSQLHLTGFPLFDATEATDPPPGLEAFLAAGDAPIVFTPGSAMIHGAGFFAESVEACRRLGKRGIFLTRHPGQIANHLPEFIRHYDYIPLSQILPRSAAIVHHGGIGTSAQALAAGIPQLVMPMAHDQPDNAARLRRLGVGRSLKPQAYTSASAARELSALLGSPTVAGKASEFAARIDPKRSVELACEVVEACADEFVRNRSTRSHITSST